MTDSRASGVPAVSIGMPVYNGERWLPEALDTLTGQTFTDFELIISDNGSTDATPEICRDYVQRDQRLRYVRQGKNLGLVHNFLYVLAEARAERFMWAADDDRWAPHFLERLVSALDRAPAASLAFCQVAVLASSERAGWLLPGLARLARVSWLPRVTAYLLQPSRAGKANLIYGLMRRDYALRCDALRRYPAFGHDMLFVFQMLLQGHVEVEPAVLFYKRQPTRRYWQLGDGFWWMLKEQLKYSVRYGDVARRCGYSFATRTYLLLLALTRAVLDTIGEVALGIAGKFRRAFRRGSAPRTRTSTDPGS